jgi:hypothetical protein
MVPALLAIGAQLGSVLERRKKENLADMEVALFRQIWEKSTMTEKAVLAKLVKGISRLEFWRKKA